MFMIKLLKDYKLRLLKQVEKFKYLGAAITSDGRQEEDIDTRIGKSSAVMRALHYLFLMKRELSQNAKLSTFKTAFVPFSPTVW